MSLKKNLFETIVGKGKILVTSIFSFSNNAFYPIKDNFFFIICATFELLFANAFYLEEPKICLCSKEL